MSGTFVITLLVVFLLSTIVLFADCCFSKILQYAHTTDKLEIYQYEILDDIFHVKCPSPFDLVFCLNGGRCFDYVIHNSSYPSCLCPDGFYGERCEEKYIISSTNESSKQFGHQKAPHKVAVANVYLAPLIIILALIIICIIHFRFFEFVSKSLMRFDWNGSPRSCCNL